MCAFALREKTKTSDMFIEMNKKPQ